MTIFDSALQLIQMIFKLTKVFKIHDIRNYMRLLTVLLLFSLSVSCADKTSSSNSDSTNQCVIDLCGNPSDSHINQLYERYLESKENYSLSEEASDLISEYSELIKQTSDLEYKSNSEIVKYYRSIKSNGKLDNILNQDFYDKIYKHMLTNHPNFYLWYDDQRSMGDRFYIEPYNPPSTDLDRKINNFVDKKISIVNELQKNLRVDYGSVYSVFPDHLIPVMLELDGPYIEINDPDILEINKHFTSCNQDCKTLINQFVSYEEIDSFIEQLYNQNLNTIDLAINVEEQMKKMITTIFSFSNFITQNYDLEDNKKHIIEDVKERFSNKMLQLLGDNPNSRDALAEFLHNFPDIVVKDFKQEIQSLLESVSYRKYFLDEDFEQVDNMKSSFFSSYISDKLNLNTYTLELSSEIHSVSYFMDHGFLSEKGMVMLRLAPTDSYSAIDNSINLSLHSILFPDVGKQSFAHEIAHAFSAFINNNKNISFQLTYNDDVEGVTKVGLDVVTDDQVYNNYLEYRQCSNELYRDPKKIEINDANNSLSPLSHAGDTIKSEEDMADLVSILLYVDEPTLSSCAFSHVMPINSIVEPIDNIIFETIDTNDKIPHSSPLLRLIREAMYKGYEMPTSCNKVMSENEDQINFNNMCF